MDNDLYKNNDPRFITTLKKNFRSHPMILELPNKLFYNNQLEAVNSAVADDPIASVFIYPKIYNYNLIRGVPVEFCAIGAKEGKQGKSPGLVKKIPYNIHFSIEFFFQIFQ